MPYLTIAHHNIHYLHQQGVSPAVFMLPSTGLGARQWQHLIEALPKRECMALNYLDCKPSDAATAPIDWRIDYRAAEALLLQQSSAVDIVGHSYGATLVLHCAIR